MVYEGESVYDRTDQDHVHGHVVPVIEHSLHKSIRKEADVDQLPALVHLSSSLPKIEENLVQLTVELRFLAVMDQKSTELILKQEK